MLNIGKGDSIAKQHLYMCVCVFYVYINMQKKARLILSDQKKKKAVTAKERKREDKGERDADLLSVRLFQSEAEVLHACPPFFLLLFSA